MAWYFHLFQNLLQFIVIHTVQHFGIDNKAEIDFFFSWNLLVFSMIQDCWHMGLWFLCLFENQFEHLEVQGSCIDEAWLGEL